MSMNDRIEALNEDEVFEVARRLLPKLVGVMEPGEAPNRAAEAIGWDVDATAELREHVERVAREEKDALIALLRLALIDAAEQDPDRAGPIIDDVGTRQTVVGLDLIVFGGFLLLSYIVYKGQGRVSVEIEEVTETNPDGTKNTTRKEKTVYLSPLSSLGDLIRRAYRSDYSS